jgi:hypothetical protein
MSHTKVRSIGVANSASVKVTTDSILRKLSLILPVKADEGRQWKSVILGGWLHDITNSVSFKRSETQGRLTLTRCIRLLFTLAMESVNMYQGWCPTIDLVSNLNSNFANF